MIEHYVAKRVALRMRGNLFYPELAMMAQEMYDERYARITGMSYLRACEYFCEWCISRNIGKEEVCHDDLLAFLEKPTNFEGNVLAKPTSSVSAGIGRLLKILMRNRPPEPIPFMELHIRDFCEWLHSVIGLKDSTISRHRRDIRAFLTSFGNGSVEEKSPVLNIDHYFSYISECAKKRGAPVASQNQGTIRHYCRFRQTNGDEQVAEFLDAYLRPPKRKRSLHHRILSSDQELELLGTIGRDTPKSKRDRATTLLMLHMGLRVSDVCALLLQDLNWDEGSMLIRNPKAQRERFLPLPNAVGRAIADYLKNGRPATDDRHVFVRHLTRRGTPIGTALSPSVIRMQLTRYFAKAGLPAELSGTHVLRHTAATRMSGGGASLKSIADVLGHKSIKTTGIYISTSDRMLNAVAMPWPKED